jgi:hypothetical protein
MARILEEKKLLSRALWNWHAVVPGSRQQVPFTVLPVAYETPYADADRLENFRQEQRRLFRLHDTHYRHHWSEGHVVPNRFIDTYFSVYVESDTNNICFNAHPLNSLMSGHPLIVLAAPGYLVRLQSMGFKTWSAVVDESYDAEPDLNTRLNLVIQQIERLCSMDPELLLDQCWSVGQHNRSHFVVNQFDLWQSTHEKLHALFARIRELHYHQSAKSSGQSRNSAC